MPGKKTLERATKDKQQGKAPSTQAGEFVREEMDHIREGKHGARSTKQAIAIGLSKARRAGVDLPPPKAGTASAQTRAAAKQDVASGAHHGDAVSPARSRAALKALKREPHAAASPRALASHARTAARKRTASERSAAAEQAAETKGAEGRSAAARKAARTRARSA